MKHINHTNINVDRAFNNYIKRTFNGLSAHTLSQVLADFMRNGWDTSYTDADDDFMRWHYIRPFAENPVLHFSFTGRNETLRMHDTSFTHLAAFIVQEDLFLAFTRRNNPDLIDIITDIVRTCPYL